MKISSKVKWKTGYITKRTIQANEEELQEFLIFLIEALKQEATIIITALTQDKDT